MTLKNLPRAYLSAVFAWLKSNFYEGKLATFTLDPSQVQHARLVALGCGYDPDSLLLKRSRANRNFGSGNRSASSLDAGAGGPVASTDRWLGPAKSPMAITSFVQPTLRPITACIFRKAIRH
jgi:hypothetical protein